MRKPVSHAHGCAPTTHIYRLNTLLLERLDGLRARVVKLARLANAQSTRAENQNLFVLRLRMLVLARQRRDWTCG